MTTEKGDSVLGDIANALQLIEPESLAIGDQPFMLESARQRLRHARSVLSFDRGRSAVLAFLAWAAEQDDPRSLVAQVTDWPGV
jgi:hypothetical protein